MTLHRTARRAAPARAAALVAAAALALTACGAEEDPVADAGAEAGIAEDVEETPPAEDPAADEVGEEDALADGPVVALEDLSADPTAYVDEPVETQGQVAEVLEESTFTIRGSEGATTQPLLVVANDSPTMVEPTGTYEVVGVVRDSFDPVAVGEELGLDLDPSLYEEYAGSPYIEAGEVTPAEAA